MRAKDFIVEKTKGKLTKRQQNPTRGLHVFGDAERISGDYTFNRVGIAAALCDGDNNPDVDYLSWIGKKKLTAPFSEIEAKMLKQAYKLAGATYTDLNHGDMNSEELDGTNTVSPVANWNKRK
jgi:hypothetical protein